jgi:hypothetical protein
MGWRPLLKHKQDLQWYVLDSFSSSQQMEGTPSWMVQSKLGCISGKKTGRLGVGIIIHDHNGVMCASKSWTRHGFLDPIAMEATTALQFKCAKDWYSNKFNWKGMHAECD